MSIIYKLSLKGSMFWQPEIVDGQKVYEQTEYINKDMEELNSIYLRQITENAYAELLTNSVVKISKDNRYCFSYPKGVLIDTHQLTQCSYGEAIAAIKKIKNNKLESEYLETIRNLLVNSNYCEYAKEKKNDIKLKKINLSSDK